MEQNTQKGRVGEEIACRILEEAGLSILERNWRYKHKEVDIIAQEADELVFVEVKVRSDSAYQTALEAVDQSKQRHLIQASNAYVGLYKRTESIRFDVVAITLLEGQRYTYEYVRRAFYPRGRR